MKQATFFPQSFTNPTQLRASLALPDVSKLSNDQKNVIAKALSYSQTYFGEWLHQILEIDGRVTIMLQSTFWLQDEQRYQRERDKICDAFDQVSTAINGHHLI